MLERPSLERRPRRRRDVPRGFLLALALLAVFALGLAVGRALEDAPRDGDVVTSVRTLTPLPQQPPTRTVTVTVTER